MTLPNLYPTLAGPYRAVNGNAGPVKPSSSGAAPPTPAVNYLNTINSQMEKDDDVSTAPPPTTASSLLADSLSDVMTQLGITERRVLTSRAEIEESNKRGHKGVDPQRGVTDSSRKSINLSKVDTDLSPLKAMARETAARSAAAASADSKDVKGMPPSKTGAATAAAAATAVIKPTPKTPKEKRAAKAEALRAADQDRRAQILRDAKQAENVRAAMEAAEKNPNKNADKKKANYDDDEPDAFVAPPSTQSADIESVKAAFAKEYEKELAAELKKAGITDRPPELGPFGSMPNGDDDDYEDGKVNAGTGTGTAAAAVALTPEQRDARNEKRQQMRVDYEQARLAREAKHATACEQYYTAVGKAEKAAEATVIANHPAAANAKTVAAVRAVSEKEQNRLNDFVRFFTATSRHCTEFAHSADKLQTAYTNIILPKGVSSLEKHPGTKKFHDNMQKQSVKVLETSRGFLWQKGEAQMVADLRKHWAHFYTLAGLELKGLPKGTTIHVASHVTTSEQMAAVTVKLFGFFCKQHALPGTDESCLKLVNPIPEVPLNFGPKDLGTCVNADGTAGVFDHETIAAALLTKRTLTFAEKKAAKTDEKTQNALDEFIGQCHSFAVYYLQNALYHARRNFVQWIFMASEYTGAFNSVNHQRNAKAQFSCVATMWYPDMKLDMPRFRAELMRQVDNLVEQIQLNRKLGNPRALYVRYHGGKPAGAGDSACFGLIVDLIGVMPVQSGERAPIGNEVNPTGMANTMYPIVVARTEPVSSSSSSGAAKASVVAAAATMGKDQKSAMSD